MITEKAEKNYTCTAPFMKIFGRGLVKGEIKLVVVFMSLSNFFRLTEGFLTSEYSKASFVDAKNVKKDESSSIILKDSSTVERRRCSPCSLAVKSTYFLTLSYILDMERISILLAIKWEVRMVIFKITKSTS